MNSFREFVKQHKFDVSLREAEAAPAMGSNPGPTGTEGGETTNKYHFDAMKQQLGMEDDEFVAAIEGGVVTLYQVPDFGWGFHPNPPIQAMVEDRGDGTYNVTFMLSQMPKNSFTLPYEDGEQPMRYQGQIEDKTEVMTEEELANAMAKPYENMGQGGGGGMGGPPMGGGMGGGMGGPPMGGGMGAPPGGMM